METLEILQNIWFILIGVLLIGYAVLDGFDLGIGSLFPLLAKTEEEKKKVIKTIWPFWDGNEVWLLTGGGALFAAFPHAYATVFSGFYLALMLVLFALIFRAVSLEFWHYDEERRGLWGWAFMAGSLIPSLLYGVALGNVIIGVPLNAKMDFTGSFFTLLRPWPLALGLLGLAAILMQGTTFAAMKNEGDIQQRARNLTKKIWLAFMGLLGVSLLLTVIFLPAVLTNVVPWIALAGVVLFSFLAKKAAADGADGRSFFMSSLSFISLWVIAGSIHYPHLVRAGNDINMSITIYNGSSTELTLKVMLIIALVGMPLVIAYSAYVYRVFRGKVQL